MVRHGFRKLQTIGKTDRSPGTVRLVTTIVQRGRMFNVRINIERFAVLRSTVKGVFTVTKIWCFIRRDETVIETEGNSNEVLPFIASIDRCRCNDYYYIIRHRYQMLLRVEIIYKHDASKFGGDQMILDWKLKYEMNMFI